MKRLLALAPLLLAAVPFVTLQDAKDAGPVVGKPAPAFRLNDHTGRAVEVGGKAEGWTVLAFFPKAATPG